MLMRGKRGKEEKWQIKRNGELGERGLVGDGGGGVRVHRRRWKLRGGCWCLLMVLVVVLTWRHREGLIIVDVDRVLKIKENYVWVEKVQWMVI